MGGGHAGEKAATASDSDGATPAGGSSTGLFGALVAPDAVLEATSERAVVTAMLRVERELVAAQADVGLAPPEAAAAIATVCDRLASSLDPAEIGRAGRAEANPVPALVRAARQELAPGAEPWLHFGATSQDVLDSALMLISAGAGRLILDSLRRGARGAAALADGGRRQVLAGRTLLQQALPITFGVKAAGWLLALVESAELLEGVLERRLAVQLGGAVGTLASLGEDATAVVEALAARLGLRAPELAWHADRTRLGELAGALGVVAGAAGKVALDVTLLAQTEVGEAVEGGAGHGGSSTLPHKHNPVSAVAAVAAARRAPGLVATLLACMLQEHERAAGAWQAEWAPLLELLAVAGGAVANAADSLQSLCVDPAAMTANLARSHGVLLAEAVALDLAPDLGRRRAGELVQRAARRALEHATSLREELAAEPEVSGRRSPERLDELCDPARYLGASDALIDRALARHRRAAEAGGAGA